MNRVTVQVKRFLLDEEGASAAEYGVLATVIVLACALAFSAAGVEVAGTVGGRL